MGVTPLVYLDFDSEADGTDHVYTASEKIDIEAALSALYFPLGVSFTTVDPAPTMITAVLFNDDAIGTSTGVDFRDFISTIDVAKVNASKGLDFMSEPLTIANLVQASINLAAHELIHIFGARHHDSYNPVGSGISGGKSKFNPVYPGPSGASFTTSDHISLTTVLAFSATTLLDDSLFIGPRTAFKIEYGKPGIPVVSQIPGNEMFLTAMPLTLAPVPVPNLIPPGTPFDGVMFDAAAIVVTGEIDAPGVVDYFVFDAVAGDKFTIELMSDTLDFRLTEFDAEMFVLSPAGTSVDYYGTPAFNDDGLEGPDPTFIDLIAPADGRCSSR